MCGKLRAPWLLMCGCLVLTLSSRVDSQQQVAPTAAVVADAQEGSMKRVAAVVTTYFPTSHAGVLVDKFVRGFPTDDGVLAPRMKLASLYIDQIHDQDIGRQVAHRYQIPLYESIRGALTLGGNELAVDAVLVIGEHGDYPVTELGQEMLPRRYFFEQVSGVHRPIRTAGAGV